MLDFCAGEGAGRDSQLVPMVLPGEALIFMIDSRDVGWATVLSLVMVEVSSGLGFGEALNKVLGIL